MKFNIKKSNIVTSRDEKPSPLLRLCGQSIPTTSSKYLGITLDRKLTFTDHINKLMSKLRHQSYTISRTISPERNPSALTVRTLVLGKIVSLLSYSLPFIKLTEAQTKKIDTIIATPLRHSLTLPRCASVQAVLLEFRVLSTRLLQQYLLLSFCRKIQSQALSPFKALLEYYTKDPSYPKVPYVMSVLHEAEQTVRIDEITPQTCLKDTFLYAHFLRCKSLAKGKHLLRLYPSFRPSLPTYLKNDSKQACNMRARLRFNLTKLNYSLFSRNQV